MGKKIVITLFFVSLLGIPVYSDSKEDFDEVVDFSVTLEAIFQTVSSGHEATLNVDKMIIIDGAISAIEIIDPEPETFFAEIELVGGKWLSYEDVLMFTCIVQVAGSDFAARIPARRSRRQIPDEIQANSHVLVAGKIIDIRQDQKGSNVAVLYGYHIRSID